VGAPRVHRHVVVEDLHVARHERDLGGAFRHRLAIDLEGFLLRFAERRHAGKRERMLEADAAADGVERAVAEREDRHAVPGLLPGRDFAHARAVEVLRQHLHQVRPPLEHPVVDRRRAGDEALAALHRRLQAEQPDVVAAVRMEADLRARHVAARVRIRVVAAEVLHVPEQVATAVLRDRAPEIRPEAEVGDRLPLAVELLHGEALQHDDAAPAQQLLAHFLGELRRRAQGEILAPDFFQPDVLPFDAPGGFDELRPLALLEAATPASHVAQILRRPRRRREHRLHRPRLHEGIPTTASISTFMPGMASSLTPMSVLAGRAAPKNSLRTGLIFARSFTSSRYTVTFRMSAKPAPAASRMSFRFRKIWRVCSAASSLTTRPEASVGGTPEMKSRSPKRTASQ